MEYPNVSSEVDDPVKIRLVETQARLNGLLDRVLCKWRKSTEEVGFPEHIVAANGRIFFGDVEYSGASKKVISGVVEQGLVKGELVLILDHRYSGQIYEFSKLVPPGAKAGTALAGGKVAGDFFGRCNQMGLSPEVAVENILISLFYWDVKLQSERVQRAQSKPLRVGQYVLRTKTDSEIAMKDCK